MAGQHEVHNQQVVVLLSGPPQAILAVEGHLHGESLRIQAPLHGGRDPGIVLDHEHLHARSVLVSTAPPPVLPQ
jgi:hypothetical protein